jgi:glycosyltransferase involved in cell wall biosynthesis
MARTLDPKRAKRGRNHLRKLAFFTSCDLSQISGPTVHVINLVNALSRAGVPTTLVAGRPLGEPALPIDPGVACHFVANPRKLHLPGALCFPLMLGAVWQHRAGTIYVRSAPGSLLAVLLARLLSPPLLALELNGWIADEARFIPGARYLRPLLGLMQRIEVAMVDRLRVVTQGLADHLHGMNIARAKVSVIRTGTSLEQFRPLDRNACRTKLGIAHAQRLMVFVGNLWDAIDMPTALKGLRILRDEGHDIRLIVIGGGPLLEHYTAVAQDILPEGAAQFLGWHPQSVAAEYIGCADIAIALFRPSHGAKTGLSPLKLRDYAASGRITIATELPGIQREGMEDWLYLVAPENPRDFADQVLLALSEHNPERENEARRYAEQNMGWQAVAEQIKREILSPERR